MSNFYAEIERQARWRWLWVLESRVTEHRTLPHGWGFTQKRAEKQARRAIARLEQERAWKSERYTITATDQEGEQ